MEVRESEGEREAKEYLELEMLQEFVLESSRRFLSTLAFKRR